MRGEQHMFEVSQRTTPEPNRSTSYETRPRPVPGRSGTTSTAAANRPADWDPYDIPGTDSDSD